MGEAASKAALTLEATTERSIEIPVLFSEFMRLLAVELFLGQRVVAKVAFDGVDPRDLSGEEAELSDCLFGPALEPRVTPPAVIVAVCGGRGGKTYVLEALRLLHLSFTVSLTTLAPGEIASAPIIAPDKDLAQQALNYVKGALEHPALAGRLVNTTAESVTVQRDDGHHVEIVCRAASARGRTGRARTLASAVMDEAAFFYDSNYVVNDEEVYKALSARIVKGGQLIIASTPYAQTGLLYDLFVANHPNPSVAGIPLSSGSKGTALAIHAPTLLLRDDEHTRHMVEREKERDPDNARREFDAQFMSTGTNAFFDANAIAQAIDESLSLPIYPKPGDVVAAGGDFGFAKNSSALVIVHRKGDVIHVAEIFERKAEADAPLKPSVVVKEFAGKVRAHSGSYLMADAHYREAIIEHLDGSELSFVDAPRDVDLPFVRLNAMLREGRIRLPNHPKLLRQMRETQARPRPGGGVKAVKPVWRTGEHGDLVDALALAVFQITGEKVPTPPTEQGSDEWEEEQQRHRKREAERKATKQWWE